MRTKYNQACDEAKALLAATLKATARADFSAKDLCHRQLEIDR
jgi:hypothetical protein